MQEHYATILRRRSMSAAVLDSTVDALARNASFYLPNVRTLSPVSDPLSRGPFLSMSNLPHPKVKTGL